MDPIFFYILTGVFLLLLIKFKLIFIFFPSIMKRFWQPQVISGPGGHRYITEMKHRLTDFNLASLNSLADAQYDKSVNFRVGGVIFDCGDEKKSLLSFYADFVSPKDEIVRQNRLMGALKAITLKDEIELLVENNTFKLFYNKCHIASITAASRRILNPSGQEIGLIEGPEYNGDKLSATENRKILLNGEEIGEYRFLSFPEGQNTDITAKKPVFQSIKTGLNEFQTQILTCIVMIDIYYNSVYYFQK
jgi:hypothetical protein